MILISGVTGFVGRSIYSKLLAEGRNPIGMTRSKDACAASKRYIYGDYSDLDLLMKACDGVSCVIHAGGIAHFFSGGSSSVFESNILLTKNLAMAALAAGVKRFVFISSIGVNGSITQEVAFREDDLPNPHVPYAQSKLEAEIALEKMLSGTSMELVVVRPPLVYAGHAPGNFSRLLKLVHSGIPLPFSLVQNQRSMISLENLVDLLVRCVDHPAAAGQLFLVSDGEDVSIGEIIGLLASGMGQRAHLFPFSDTLMRFGSKLINKESLYTQLCASLVIDSSKSRTLLGWVPVVSCKAALFDSGRNYIARI